MKSKTVILITGCSTGIGRELCNILSKRGYIVVATARSIETIKDLPVSLRLSIDVTKEETISIAIKEVISKFEKIDILVNNAGYSTRGALEEIDVNKVKYMFDVNLFGIINMLQAVIPEMHKRQTGKIINISSISGKFVQPINGMYCASKYAVEALSQVLRLELKNSNIQTTVIEPGPIKTNFFKTMLNNSKELMTNANSYYVSFYEADDRYRGKQKLTESREAAKIIADIILKKRLKLCYKVAVPFTYKIITHLPDFFREYIMKKF